MSVLTNQTSINGRRNYFAPAEGHSGGGSFSNLTCSTLTAAVSVTSPSVSTGAITNLNSINGFEVATNGVGSVVDANVNLTISGYLGVNYFGNVSAPLPGASLALEPVGGGAVGGRWIQTTVVPGGVGYGVQALTGGVGSNYETIEVIQSSDTTSRLYMCAGNNGQGDLGTTWSKVSGTYTKEIAQGGLTFTLTPNIGGELFSTVTEYQAAPFLKYHVAAQGRIILNAGSPTTSDLCVVQIGFPVQQPFYTCGTLVPLPSAVASIPFTVSGTVSNPVGFSPINAIYADNQTGGTAIYELRLDSFTVSQL